MGIGVRGSARIAIAALFVGGLALSPATGLAQDPTQEDASVRIVHASPDAPAVDVLIDGGIVASDVSFGTASNYMAVSSGSHQIQVVPTGQPASSAVIDEEVEFEEGDAYIVAAAGLLNEIEARVFDVNLDDTEDSQARVRSINLSTDEGGVDLYVAGGDEITNNTEFGDASDYEDVDAGTYDLEVRENDSDAVRIAVPGVVIDSGRVYDIVTIGQTADSSLNVLPLETRVSPSCGDVLGVGTDADACVRVLHASPDAPAVDVYVNDTLVIENLAFGAATEYAALPAGDDRNIKIVATGSPLDAAVVDTDIDLGEGDAYTIIATNNLEDISTKVVEDNLEPLPVDQARITVVHAAPNTPGVDVVITDGPTLFEGVDFEDVTDAQIVDAGTYDLQLKDGDNVVARAADVVLEAGMNYDIVAIGSAEDNTLQVVVLSSPSALIDGSLATPSGASTTDGGGLTEQATPEVVTTPTN